MKYKKHPIYTNQIIMIETDNWYISLWQNQYYLGRASIILKDKNKRYISELNEKEVSELFDLMKSYEIALKKSFNTTNFNWTCLMNNSYKQENKNNPDPLHIHIWPRYEKEIKFNNEIFKDEVFSHHYDKSKIKNVDEKFLKKLADEIVFNWKK